MVEVAAKQGDQAQIKQMRQRFTTNDPALGAVGWLARHLLKGKGL